MGITGILGVEEVLKCAVGMLDVAQPDYPKNMNGRIELVDHPSVEHTLFELAILDAFAVGSAMRLWFEDRTSIEVGNAAARQFGRIVASLLGDHFSNQFSREMTAGAVLKQRFEAYATAYLKGANHHNGRDWVIGATFARHLGREKCAYSTLTGVGVMRKSGYVSRLLSELHMR